jgi:hypothetical protein
MVILAISWLSLLKGMGCGFLEVVPSWYLRGVLSIIIAVIIF